MLIIRKLTFVFITFILMSGCGIVREHYMEEGKSLYKDVTALSIHLESKAGMAEDRGDQQEAIVFYNILDDLGEACDSLQASSYKKLFGGVRSFFSKVGTIFSLASCEKKVDSLKKEFPGYIQSNVTEINI